MTEEAIISNVEIEQEVLGTVIMHGVTEEFMRLALSDFGLPKHEIIAATLQGMVSRGVPITLTSVAAELDSRHQLGRLGGTVYLHTLMTQAAPVGMNLGYYCEVLRQKSRARAVEALGVDLVNAARGYNEIGEDVAEWLGRHHEKLEAIPPPFGEGEDDSHDSLDTILRESDEEAEPLIPGYLYRQERHVVVAPEGVVKSTLLRQHAVCLAAGLHPWTGQRVSDGLRVLFIDAENSRNQSRRAYRWVANRCYRPTMAPGWKQRVIHKTRNEGVDLPGRDAEWFRNTVYRSNPDVIILGPAYKLARPNPKLDAESSAMNLFSIVDEVRARHNCAVLIEAHAPHGYGGSRDMRPFGASAWLRWPEVGVGFYRDSDVPDEHQQRRPEYLQMEDWRGMREFRDWPPRIRYGDTRNEMPWVPSDPDWKPSVDFDYVIPLDEQGE
jgi:hypothetical protein